MQTKFTVDLTPLTSQDIQTVDLSSSKPGTTSLIIRRKEGTKIVQLTSELQLLISERLQSFAGDLISALLSSLPGAVTQGEKNPVESATPALYDGTRSGSVE